MRVTACKIPGVIIIEPRLFEDERGFFLESYQSARFDEAGINLPFVQDNHSRSIRGTLRGLHYQIQHPQGKLVWTVRGEIYDVAVDLRLSSPTFGQHWSTVLSESNHRQVYLPPGLAHGFCVTSDVADIVYKCTDYYCPEYERTLRWDDDHLMIAWPVTAPRLSAKDARGMPFMTAPYYDTDNL